MKDITLLKVEGDYGDELKLFETIEEFQKYMNEHLDWILSGEWRKTNGNDSERLHREKDEGDTLQQ